MARATETTVRIATAGVILEGNLVVPHAAHGVVLFAHGSGSSRHSPRNRFVAEHLRSEGLGTLLLDLLTEAEETEEHATRHLRFDIEMLARRLLGATDWLRHDLRTRDQPIGTFGASTGGGAALLAAAERAGWVDAVVSRGGRPDLAGAALPRVQAPTLLIVGGNDETVLDLNRWALERLGTTKKELAVVPGASHLFEEPGTLDQVARLAAGWFHRFLHPSQVGV